MIIPLFLFSQQDQYVDHGELLIPRYGLSAVTDGEWVYAIGGAHVGANGGKAYAVSGLLAAHERINPITLQSEYFAEGLFRRANHSSVFINGGILSCGGRTQHGLDRHRTSTCEFFYPDSLILRPYPFLPDRLRTLGMTVVNGQVFVVGGLGDGDADKRFTFSSKTFLLDTENNQWKRLDDMPFPREGKIVSVGNKIYALGGYNGSVLKTVMVFDTESLTWERKKDLPYGLSAFTAVADSNFIYIFGDYTKRSTIHRYNLKSGDLYLLEQEITPRRHLDAVIVGQKVIVIGGNQNSFDKALSTIEAFELSALRKGGKKVEVTE